VQDCVFLPI